MHVLRSLAQYFTKKRLDKVIPLIKELNTCSENLQNALRAMIFTQPKIKHAFDLGRCTSFPAESSEDKLNGKKEKVHSLRIKNAFFC